MSKRNARWRAAAGLFALCLLSAGAGDWLGDAYERYRSAACFTFVGGATEAVQPVIEIDGNGTAQDCDEAGIRIDRSDPGKIKITLVGSPGGPFYKVERSLQDFRYEIERRLREERRWRIPSLPDSLSPATQRGAPKMSSDEQLQQAAQSTGGRPTLCTPEVIEDICDALLSRDEETGVTRSLAGICRSWKDRPDRPSERTVIRWLDEEASPGEPYDTFRRRYARSRQLACDMIFDEILAIADDSSGDEMYDDRGNRLENREFVNRSRLRVDTRKWALGRMHPARFGDRVALDHSGHIGMTFADLTKAAAEAAGAAPVTGTGSPPALGGPGIGGGT
jgi:hypothetical protein